MRVLSSLVDRENEIESPEFHKSKGVVWERDLKLESSAHGCCWENVGHGCCVGVAGLNQVFAMA